MNDEIAYQEALDYIYSFIDYSLQRVSRYAEANFDLARMHEFTALLGTPQQTYPVIHIAGTKGKGSTAAFCTSVLRASGYQVGTYTSPHLEDYAERIQINGQPISHGELAALVEEIKPAVAAVPGLTTFEITTGLAFLHFARRKVNAAVIEVGLGGRLDATNVVAPLVSVITSLSYDHMYLLGDTLTAIAGEKAGIIKQGRPVVSAPQKEEARLVVEQVAARCDAPLVQVGTDYRYLPLEHSLSGQSFYIWRANEQKQMETYLQTGDLQTGHLQDWAPARYEIPLLGVYQVENAVVAYAALQAADAAGLPVPEDAIRRGFASARWPGRFEIVRVEPPVVIDSAHNRDSAQKLRQALDDYFPGRPVVMITGASEDKDLEGIYAELLPRVQQMVATQAVHPRAIDPAQLVELARKFDCPAVAVPKVDDALEQALQMAGNEAVVLSAGSIFVAAEVRSAWYAKHRRDRA